MKKKTLTPLILGGIFFFMLGLSFAAVPLYDLFCRVTGFGGTTQVSKEAPKIVLDNVISVRLDTNVNSNLSWDFKAKKNLLDVKPGKVYNIDFEVQNVGNEPSAGVASYNVSPSSFGQYFNLLFANDTNYFNTILYWVCWIDIFNPIFSTDLILQLYLF